jgi:uncharacterized iron-regulated protein
LRVLQAAYKHQDNTDNDHLVAAPATRESEFDIGSFVLVQYENDEHRPPTKVHPKLRGPFQVISITRRENRGSIYTCENLATHKREDFHVKLLQQFHYDPRYVDPAIEALVDSESFIIEDILDHVFEGKRQLKTELKFKVKWLGYDQTTWEPYSNVAKVKKLHDYLRANHMEKYIQDAFRTPKPQQQASVTQKRALIPHYEEGTRQSSRAPKERRLDD